MNKVINISDNAKVHLSYCQQRGLQYKTDGVVERIIKSVPGTDIKPCRVFLEALIHRGPRMEYGALGVEFTPSNGQQLIISVNYCSVQEKQWANALSTVNEKILIGLPREFASATLDGLLVDLTSPPSGTIRVAEAAYGIVGSSSSLFFRIARAIAKIVALNEKKRNEEELTHLLSTTLVYS